SRPGWRDARQRVCRHRRAEGRRPADRVRDPEDRRRRARQTAIMFVNTFIQRPILTSVCSLVIILAGVVAIPTMPVAQYPPLAPPNITVLSIYTGANAQEVETAVTTPLEQAINGVEGMLYMTSSSTNSGISTINVTFDVTRDQDLAQVDVQNRVAQALGRLPTEVRQLGVTVNKQATGFVMAVGVYAEH